MRADRVSAVRRTIDGRLWLLLASGAEIAVGRAFRKALRARLAGIDMAGEAARTDRS